MLNVEKLTAALRHSLDGFVGAVEPHLQILDAVALRNVTNCPMVDAVKTLSIVSSKTEIVYFPKHGNTSTRLGDCSRVVEYTLLLF